MTNEVDQKAAFEPPLECVVMRRVVCAAVLVEKLNNEEVIVCGVRHYDTLMRQHLLLMGPIKTHVVQGFVDQRGEFLTREEAWPIAEEAGQIIRRVGGDNKKLFSENLY